MVLSPLSAVLPSWPPAPRSTADLKARGRRCLPHTRDRTRESTSSPQLSPCARDFWGSPSSCSPEDISTVTSQETLSFVGSTEQVSPIFLAVNHEFRIYPVKNKTAVGRKPRGQRGLRGLACSTRSPIPLQSRNPSACPSSVYPSPSATFGIPRGSGEGGGRSPVHLLAMGS